MRTIVCISDTHGHHADVDVPAGDLLIHAGDLTRYGQLDEVTAFNTWLGTLSHSHKVVIAGNHDWCFQKFPAQCRARLSNAIYLCDEAVTLEGIRIYGSPWQPWFFDWAFNLERGPEIAAKWALIPEDTDILVTHGPPYGIGDRTTRGDFAGCSDLLARVRAVKPKLHVFGHIHEGAGVYAEGGTRFVNASVYEGVGEAVVVDWRPASFQLTGNT